MLTRTSVVWADRMVATISSSGLAKSSSQCASGYARASSRITRRARRTSAVRDSPVGVEFSVPASLADRLTRPGAVTASPRTRARSDRFRGDGPLDHLTEHAAGRVRRLKICARPPIRPMGVRNFHPIGSDMSVEREGLAPVASAAVPGARKAAPAPRPRRERSDDFVHLSLGRLRSYRQALAEEENRVSYWRRIVQARLDLVRAGAKGDPVHS